MCQSCPRRQKREAFEQEVLAAWGRWLSDEQRVGLNFDDMLIEVYRASSLRGQEPDEISVSISQMLYVFENESDRYDKQQSGVK